MRLEGALFTSREGLLSHGRALSVIGDNVANANTIGYKPSRVEFKDLVTEGLDGRESETLTGGNGVTLNRVRQIFEPGVLEQTGRALDVGIAGQGFFIVQGDQNNNYYSRAGNFSINEEGVLVNSDSRPVLGFRGTATEGELSELNLLNLDLTGSVTTDASIFGNLNSSEPISDQEFPDAPDSFLDIASSATTISNLSVFDSLGGRRDITVAFRKVEGGIWEAAAYIDGKEVDGGEEGKPVKLGATVTLRFNPNGTIDAANQGAAQITATPRYNGGAAPGNFTINLSNFTQLATSTQITGFSQDGQGAGQIKTYEVRKNGELFAILDSGSSIQVGTIATAYFPNVDDLQRVGNNLFFPGGANTPDVGTPNSGARGELRGSSLEGSTVDLADQFVDLVLYQRGYQASSQILNVTSDIIRDTLALIR